MGLDHSCRHWSRGRVPKTGRCSVCFFSKLRCCLPSGKRRVLGGTEQPQTQLYQVGGLYAKADLSDSSALMLRETSSEPFLRLENRKPLVSEGNNFGSRPGQQSSLPFSTQLSDHCRPSVSGHHQPAESHRREGGGGEAKAQRGADARSGMDPATTHALPPRDRAPRFIPGSYIDPPRRVRGVLGVSPCHASGITRCPFIRGPYK